MSGVDEQKSGADVSDSHGLLAGVMSRDRARLSARLLALTHAGCFEGDPEWESLRTQIERSQRQRDARYYARPRPRFDADLPVVLRRQEIADAIDAHQVVVLCGETGSGKTTQLPQICLDLGRGAAGLIGHTQPRRIAARSVAARIADELGTKVGPVVGYHVRFDDRTGPDACIKVLTDGILLAEIERDRLLQRYDTIILDEAHERSLNIDFLLGFLKQLLPKRPDLKLIITSATIDPARFGRHFGDAPVLSVEGRTYPVEIRYRPIGADDSRDGADAGLDPSDAIVEAARELMATGPATCSSSSAANGRFATPPRRSTRRI